MKVAFFVSEFPSLSETFILNQITGLLDRGHEVYIYARKSTDYQVVHHNIKKYNLLDRTFYYTNYDSLQIPMNKCLRILKSIYIINKNIYKNPVPLFRSLNFFKYGKESLSLRLFYKTVLFLDQNLYSYDIVHGHFGPNGNIILLLKNIGVVRGNILTTFYGYDISRYIKDEGRNAYKSLFSVGNVFIAISEIMKWELAALGCNIEKIMTHKLGIDVQKFPFSPRKRGSDGKIKLLTIARFVEKKGLKYGIEAIATLIKKYPIIEYQIVGDGLLRNDMIDLIDKLRLNNHIKLVGWKNQDNVLELMKEAHILLAPSVVSEDGDREGTPVVLMEAMACGLPVLSTQHSGIPELVQDGRSGFLVPERDIQTLADRLEYLITHQESWPEMGQAGRAYVEQHHDIHKLNDQLVKLYQQILDGEFPQDINRDHESADA